jgi:hypothetical protein
MFREEDYLPFWKRKGNQKDQPDQETAGKKEALARGGNNIVDKETDLEKKIIVKECQREIEQVEVLRRMRKDPSWDLAVETLLLCEKNPSDAELIAIAITKRRMKRASPFRNENISDNQ